MSQTRRAVRRTPCDRPCAGLCRPDGFAAAHRANRPWLLARARALLGDPGAAEDAVQETFLRAWAACRASTRRPARRSRPGSARSAATSPSTCCAPASVRPRLAAEADDRDERSAAPTEAVDAALQRMVLLDALSQVSPEHRGVVLLAVVRDRPYADVAAALDIPVGTVKSRVHHALRGMRRSLLSRSNRARGLTV